MYVQLYKLVIIINSRKMPDDTYIDRAFNQCAEARTQLTTNKH